MRNIDTHEDNRTSVKEFEINYDHLSQFLEAASLLEKTSHRKEETIKHHRAINRIEYFTSFTNILSTVYNGLYLLAHVKTENKTEATETLVQLMHELETKAEYLYQCSDQLKESYQSIYDFYEVLNEVNDTSLKTNNLLKTIKETGNFDPSILENIQTFHFHDNMEIEKSIESIQEKNKYEKKQTTDTHFRHSKTSIEKILDQLNDIKALVSATNTKHVQTYQPESISYHKETAEPQTKQLTTYAEEDMSHTSTEQMVAFEEDQRLTHMKAADQKDMSQQQAEHAKQEQINQVETMSETDTTSVTTADPNSHATADDTINETGVDSSDELDQTTRTDKTKNKAYGFFGHLFKPERIFTTAKTPNHGVNLLILFSIITAGCFFLLIENDERSLYLGPGNMSIFLGGILLTWILSAISITSMSISFKLMKEKVSLKKLINYFGLYSFIPILINIATLVLFYKKIFYYGSITILVAFTFLFILVPIHLVLRLIKQKKGKANFFRAFVGFPVSHALFLAMFYFITQGSMLDNLLEKVYFILTVWS